MTSPHPFVPHYETRSEHKQAEQLTVIQKMYLAYGRNIGRTTGALVILGWSESEAQEAAKDAVKYLDV